MSDTASLTAGSRPITMADFFPARAVTMDDFYPQGHQFIGPNVAELSFLADIPRESAPYIISLLDRLHAGAGAQVELLRLVRATNQLAAYIVSPARKKIAELEGKEIL